MLKASYGLSATGVCIEEQPRLYTGRELELPEGSWSERQYLATARSAAHKHLSTLNAA